MSNAHILNPARNRRRATNLFVAISCAVLAVLFASPGAASQGGASQEVAEQIQWRPAAAPPFTTVAQAGPRTPVSEPSQDEPRLAVTTGFGGLCPEGTVRPGFQMYVTLLKSVDGTITIYAMTNKGTFTADVPLTANVRSTFNMNSLVAPGGPLAGQTDVDTAMMALSVTDTLFVACPVYFNAGIGGAGGVSGGHVQVAIDVVV